MRCTSCEKELMDDEVKWAYDEPYCEDCYDRTYTYCSRCDSTIQRENAHYGTDGEYYCDDCWEEGYDDEAPNNPAVYEEDRDLIVHLSRLWLKGKTEYRRLIAINEYDPYLKIIRMKVGLTKRSIYVFGLRDREDYSLTASEDILDDVKEYAMLHLGVTVIQGIGSGRLGVSLSLREHQQDAVIALIKRITTTVKEEEAVCAV